MKLLSPKELTNSIIKKISPQGKLAFISTFISGMLIHLYIITHYMLNQDEAHNMYVCMDRTDMGRWAQVYFSKITSDYSLSVVGGIITMLAFAVAAGFLIHALDIKNSVLIVLSGACFVAFPSVTCMMSYTFMTEIFGFSALFACAQIFLVKTIAESLNSERVKIRDMVVPVILAAVCLCISMGLYQAYLSVMLVSMLIIYVKYIAEPAKYKDKNLIQLGIAYVAILGIGTLFYYLAMVLSLKLRNTQLITYMGLDSGASMSVDKLIGGTKGAIKDCIIYLKDKSYVNYNPYVLIGTILAAGIILACIIRVFITNKVYTNILRILLTGFCLVCAPLSFSVIYLISNEVSYHGLMRHVWVLVFIGAASMFEWSMPYFKLNMTRILEWLVVISLVLVTWNYILLDNIAYYNMNFRYQRTVNLCQNVMEMVKHTEDYDSHRPMAFIGRYSKTYVQPEIKELLDFMVGCSGKRAFDEGARNFVPFICNVLGDDIEGVTPEREEELKATSEFEEMAIYPKEGCIRVIDDVTVVKFND